MIPPYQNPALSFWTIAECLHELTFTSFQWTHLLAKGDWVAQYSKQPCFFSIAKQLPCQKASSLSSSFDLFSLVLVSCQAGVWSSKSLGQVMACEWMIFYLHQFKWKQNIQLTVASHVVLIAKWMLFLWAINLTWVPGFVVSVQHALGWIDDKT